MRRYLFIVVPGNKARVTQAQWAAKGGHDSLGMNEWSDWQYILFLRVVWPKKSFHDIFRAPVSSQTKLFRYFEFFV